MLYELTIPYAYGIVFIARYVSCVIFKRKLGPGLIDLPAMGCLLITGYPVRFVSQWDSLSEIVIV
jgi:hypothetical protein